MGQLPKKVGGNQKAPTTKHKTTNERGYGADWRKIRLTVIARYGGLCAECKAAWAEHVHHVSHDTSDCSEENLIPLCRACHINIHRADSHKA